MSMWALGPLRKSAVDLGPFRPASVRRTPKEYLAAHHGCAYSLVYA